MNPSQTRSSTKRSILSAMVRAEPTKDCRALTSIMSWRMDRCFSAASSRHVAAVPSGSLFIRTDARPGAMVSPTAGSTSGRGPSGSYDDRSRFQTCSSSLMAVGAAHLLLADVAGQLLRLGVAVPEDEGGRRQHHEVVGLPAVAGEPPLDVVVERPARASSRCAG